MKINLYDHTSASDVLGAGPGHFITGAVWLDPDPDLVVRRAAAAELVRPVLAKPKILKMLRTFALVCPAGPGHLDGDRLLLQVLAIPGTGQLVVDAKQHDTWRAFDQGPNPPKWAVTTGDDGTSDGDRLVSGDPDDAGKLRRLRRGVSWRLIDLLAAPTSLAADPLRIPVGCVCGRAGRVRMDSLLKVPARRVVYDRAAAQAL